MKCLRNFLPIFLLKCVLLLLFFLSSVSEYESFAGYICCKYLFSFNGFFWCIEVLPSIVNMLPLFSIVTNASCPFFFFFQRSFSLPKDHGLTLIILSKLFCFAFSHLGLWCPCNWFCVCCEVFKSLHWVRKSLGLYGPDYNLVSLLGYYLQFKSICSYKILLIFWASSVWCSI